MNSVKQLDIRQEEKEFIPSVRPRFVRKAEQDARLRSEAGERDARLSIEA